MLAVIEALKKKADFPEFEFIEINCLRIQTPHDAYSLLWSGISVREQMHLLHKKAFACSNAVNARVKTLEQRQHCIDSSHIFLMPV